MQAVFPFRAGWRSLRFWPEGMSLDPVQSINGTETIIPTLRGRWRTSGEVVIRSEEGVQAWQAFLAQMEGRLGTTLVPYVGHYGAKDRDGQHIPVDRVAALDTSSTWEGFGFETAPVATVTLAADAPLRARRIVLRYADTLGLRPGGMFSIGDHLHQVQSVWQTGVRRAEMTIRPPLRAPASAGTRVEIERPVCRMRLITEETGQFSQTFGAFMAKIPVEFVEAV